MLSDKELFENRKNREVYLNLFNNINFYPTIEDISKFVCKTEEEVKFDLSRFYLMTYYKNLKNKLSSLLERKKIYDEYYFSKYYYDISKLSEKLNVSINVVKKDIVEIYRRFYCRELKLSEVPNRHYYFSDKEKKEIIGKFKCIFETFTYIPKMEKFFFLIGLDNDMFFYVLHEFNLFEDYLSFRRKEQYFKRLSHYKKYYFGHSAVSSKQDIARRLSIPISQVNSEIEEVSKKYGLKCIRKSNLRNKELSVYYEREFMTYSGYYFNFQDRVKEYNMLIQKYGKVPSFFTIERELEFPDGVIRSDLRYLGLRTENI